MGVHAGGLETADNIRGLFVHRVGAGALRAPNGGKHRHRGDDRDVPPLMSHLAQFDL